MIYLGIDPGLHGAVASMWDSVSFGIQGVGINVSDTPTYKGDDGKDKYNRDAMAALLDPYQSSDEVVAVLEDVHSMPKQGVASSFNFGVGKGIWLGIIAAYKIPLILVSPQRWKKTMELGKDKNDARALAIKLFPTMTSQLNLVKHDGRAEAILMAEYARRQRKEV